MTIISSHSCEVEIQSLLMANLEIRHKKVNLYLNEVNL